MNAQHTKSFLDTMCLLAASTMGALLIGGGALGATVTAAAAAPAHVAPFAPQSSRGCDEVWGDDGCDHYGDRGEPDQGGEGGGGRTARH
ncbi:hypothetical protein [Streptomyces sp. AF1A]|uniref:hypothetical protein n=1 Tax=Streptomyces sp. AF1A TaxID=3394350 RepID=UPI0039BCC377